MLTQIAQFAAQVTYEGRVIVLMESFEQQAGVGPKRAQKIVLLLSRQFIEFLGDRLNKKRGRMQQCHVFTFGGVET